MTGSSQYGFTETKSPSFCWSPPSGLGHSLLLMIFSSFICLKMVSRITFPRLKLILTSLLFLRSFFLPFLKLGVASVLLQTLDTFLSCHSQWKMIKSGLTMTSAGSHSPCGCRACKYVYVSISWLTTFHKEYNILVPAFSSVSKTWVLGGQCCWQTVMVLRHRLTQTEAKKAFSTLVFSPSMQPGPHLIQPIFSLFHRSLSCCLDISVQM